MFQIGFITNCLTIPLPAKIGLARRMGFSTLEVACWPSGSARGCDIDAGNVDDGEINQIVQALHREHMTISTLAYYENMLIPDCEHREKHRRHLHDVIRLAHMLGVPNVATYVGKDETISLSDNFICARDYFTTVVGLASALDVNVLVENCPMPTWNPEGNPGTITYTPELLYRLFRTIDDPHFGLNFDPSHLYWQRIDYLRAAADMALWIRSIHVKDVTTLLNRPDRYGIYGKKVEKASSFDFGYYRAVLPGFGDIRWLDLLKALHRSGFSGPLQVEYKNSNGFGEIADPELGLRMSAKYLKDIVELGERA